jgi:hypothetical protein
MALWHLDEGSGRITFDSSGNGRHGHLDSARGLNSAGPAWSTDSPVGRTGPAPSQTPAASSTGTPTPIPRVTRSPRPRRTPTPTVFLALP